VSGDTLLLGATVTTFTVSLPTCPTSPMSTTPTMREPFNRVSVSAAADNLMAVPLAPAVLMIAPEVVMVLPTPPSPLAAMAMLPEMMPVLAFITLAARSARIPSWPPRDESGVGDVGIAAVGQDTR
jgi:hypothetical protein